MILVVDGRVAFGVECERVPLRVEFEEAVSVSVSEFGVVEEMLEATEVTRERSTDLVQFIFNIEDNIEETHFFPRDFPKLVLFRPLLGSLRSGGTACCARDGHNDMTTELSA